MLLQNEIIHLKLHSVRYANYKFERKKRKKKYCYCTGCGYQQTLWAKVSGDLDWCIHPYIQVGLVLGELMCKCHDWEFTQWLAKSETTQRARNFTLHIITLSSYTDFGDWILKLWCQSFFENTHEGDLVTVLPLQLPHNKSSVTKQRSRFKLLSNISAIIRNQQLPGRSGTNLIHWKVADNTV